MTHANPETGSEPAIAESSRHRISVTLCTACFLSGASALIFETLWFRLAGLTFGNSVWACALVLTSFMGGLALGNAVAITYGYRVQRPIRLYAIVEITVAVSGVGLVLLFPLVTGWLAPLFRAFFDTHWATNCSRLLLSFGLMMIPATAMGMTLPLLVRALHQDNPNFGQALGRLYGWNTLGGVLGTIASETVLVGLIGIRGTGLFAGLLNLVSSLIALRLAQTVIEARVSGSQESRFRWNRSLVSVNRVLMLGSAFLAGAILLALEDVWFRFLVLFVKGHTLAFAVMLAVVLTGIALGGVIAASWFRLKPRAHDYLAEVALFSAIVSILVYLLFEYVPHTPSARTPEWAFILYNAAPLMFPVSLLSGVLFTLIGATMYEEIGGSLEATGLLTMVNTVGAVVGSVAGVFFFLAKLGMETSFFVLSVSYAVIAIAAVVRERLIGSKKPYGAIAALGVSFAVAIAVFPFGSMDRYMLFVGGLVCPKETGWSPIAIREGLTETSQYWQKQYSGNPLFIRLLTNNYSMSGTKMSAKRYMNSFVYWPAAVHPDLRNALLICFGVGNTCKALTEVPSLQAIDVVDISKNILESSDIIFPKKADNPLNDPRVKTYVEDGRFYLQASRKKYDLITGEPPPPVVAGVVNLYSQEYFQLIYDHLEEGGIVTYWLPVAQLTMPATKSILKAFCNVFHDCSLWTGSGFEWVMIGTRNGGSAISEENFSRHWSALAKSSELRRCGFENPAQLGATFLMDSHQLKAFTERSLPVVDDFPQRILGERGFGLDDIAEVMDSDQTRERFEQSLPIRTLWPESLRNETLAYFWVQGLINTVLLKPYQERIRSGSQNPKITIEAIHEVLSRTSLRIAPLWMMGEEYVDMDLVADSLAAGSNGILPGTWRFLGARAMADRDFLSAAKYFAEGEKGDPKLVTLRAYSLCMAGQIDAARSLIRESEGELGKPENKAFLSWLTDTFALNGGSASQ